MLAQKNNIIDQPDSNILLSATLTSSEPPVFNSMMSPDQIESEMDDLLASSGDYALIQNLKATNVDLKSIKERMWGIFGEKEAKPKMKFTDVVATLKNQQKDKDLSMISLNQLFLCVLHISNERSLFLESVKGKSSDFCINLPKEETMDIS